jgi:hypothetical protein
LKELISGTDVSVVYISVCLMLLMSCTFSS